jgi:hypothetical protein
MIVFADYWWSWCHRQVTSSSSDISWPRSADHSYQYNTAQGKRYLLLARNQWMNTKRSALNSKQWKSCWLVKKSLAEWKKWDISLTSWARTWYLVEHVISNVGCVFWILLSRSPLCVAQMVWTKCCFQHFCLSVYIYYWLARGFSKCFHNVLSCVTYGLLVACSHKLLSVGSVKLQESARSKYKTCDVLVAK